MFPITDQTPFLAPLISSAQDFEERAGKELVRKGITNEKSVKGSKDNPLRILHVALECRQAQVGGLGSVASALVPMQANYAQKSGRHDRHMKATLITPFYDCIQKLLEPTDCTLVGSFPHYYKGAFLVATVFKTQKFGYNHLFISPDPEYETLFAIEEAQNLYKTVQHASFNERMAYFSSAVGAFATHYVGKNQSKPFDVINCHAWHTAITALLIKEVYAQRLQNLGYHVPGVVFTVHSLRKGDEGMGLEDELRKAGLFRKSQVNLSAELAEVADCIVTVSQGMIPDLLAHTTSKTVQRSFKKAHKSERIVGITNGIYTTTFRPDCNAKLGPFRYVPGQNVSEWKHAIKVELRSRKILQSASRPLVTFIGRYSKEKGIDMLSTALKVITEQNASFVMMGLVTGGAEAEEIIQKLEDKKEKRHFHIMTTKQEQEDYGQLVRAASDFFLMPSHDEPCGLVQMEGFCTGALAITSRVQGLKDTVADIRETEQGNGFMYEDNEDRLKNLKKCLKTALGFFDKLSDVEKSALQERLINSYPLYDWNGGDRLERYFTIYSQAKELSFDTD